ncbi:glucosamine-6-phosphate deaminase [Longirhabdus pacifica]|uniref:glucosamine-6-phosphate deaminase n=1 Tax=Longirhabdus pacifica TaxID=2305227 RepID=UPI001009348C|nr:glucosamine-6-phosphate deaminase [Longirhabdus pacifica]
MKIIKVKDYQTLSEHAAQYVINKVKAVPNITLGLATGGTPKGMYDVLIRDHAKNGTSYKDVTSFNLDEYIGIGKEDPQSYYHYMYDSLFDHIDMKDEHIHIPSGTEKDTQLECETYENKMEAAGGIDLQILGIGNNGHIGFNEPGTSFDIKTHVVELDVSTREANARYFDSIDKVPTHAITMGISSIMKSKEILLLISGKEKSDAWKGLLKGDISTAFPASILNTHDNVTVIVDEDAMVNVELEPAK